MTNYNSTCFSWREDSNASGVRWRFTYFVSEMNSIVLMTFVIRFQRLNKLNLFNCASEDLGRLSRQLNEGQKIYNEDLKYAELEYACINGGKNFKTTSTGERPNHKIIWR